MKFLGLGVPELVIILVVVLIIFGPKNLPKLGNALGKGIKGLRKGVESGKDKIDEKFDAVEEEKAAEVEVTPMNEQDSDSSDAEAEPSNVRRVKRVVKVQPTDGE